MGIRLPGRGDRGDAVGDDRIRRAVARDDVQRVAGPVGDPGVQSAARPARVTDGLRPRERPARLSALGVERDELASPRGDDEEPARRPRRVLVVAEQALRAVLVDDPRAFRRQNEQAAGGGQLHERGLRRLAPDGVAEAVDDRHARRRQRRDHDRPRGHERDERPAALPRPGDPLARLERGVDCSPCALCCAGLVGERYLPESAAHAVFAHEVSLVTRSCRASRPRRRRELTVPRGSSRRSAISPGE